MLGHCGSLWLMKLFIMVSVSNVKYVRWCSMLCTWVHDLLGTLQATNQPSTSKQTSSPGSSCCGNLPSDHEWSILINDCPQHPHAHAAQCITHLTLTAIITKYFCSQIIGLKGKSTGNHGLPHDILGFPVSFHFINQFSWQRDKTHHPTTTSCSRWRSCHGTSSLQGF